MRRSDWMFSIFDIRSNLLKANELCVEVGENSCNARDVTAAIQADALVDVINRREHTVWERRICDTEAARVPPHLGLMAGGRPHQVFRSTGVAMPSPEQEL